MIGWKWWWRNRDTALIFHVEELWKIEKTLVGTAGVPAENLLVPEHTLDRYCYRDLLGSALINGEVAAMLSHPTVTPLSSA
jgi:hypothetical protein